MSLATALGLFVSIAVLIATVILGALRFRHERKLADLSDARALLADCAVELARAKDSLGMFYTAPPMFPRTHREENVDTLLRVSDDLLRGLQAHLAALGLRLSWSDPVVVEFSATVDAMEGFRREFDLFPPTSLSAAQEYARAGHMTAQVNAFDAHSEAFLKSAQKAVGYRLPSND